MTYEEFKQLAEHPQHRDVPAIFKLEVLEIEELEEKKRSHYPKYKVKHLLSASFHHNSGEGAYDGSAQCPDFQLQPQQRPSAGYAQEAV